MVKWMLLSLSSYLHISYYNHGSFIACTKESVVLHSGCTLERLLEHLTEKILIMSKDRKPSCFVN